ncbi:hypothetical protein WICANDRAFT_81157 [Wickerhamomyces anomalus NRRL Y-366-8]|uniref:Uncharacterized protein n=1 Tax=Wickerhamomyces anomalus (strain ATCC 58044 / CBS 1984 / NCYC 433 / NRRL Y-366-8) TaxID=683960 RepID=A0A1E3NXA4_WICAA|nr:uncharacterized protein WICANDRAFT_81157 [Wickerhamomyces anomalus NRRL Y-366-8]ODQ57829.1 hypothetical protein WICANDRAFT_81157 [Wickerhamomyces anomalus NRRL Y-366-8]
MESMDIDVESVLRSNSIWLHGVDNLSTKEIKAYLKNFTDDDFKIEWINDTSLNVVFENDEDASTNLKKFTKEQDREFSPTDEREAQDFEGKPDVSITLRISNLSDKKVKNAAQYSRYYLYNPPNHGTERRSRKSSRGSSYREREPVVFKRSNSRDVEEDDGNDLFPDKAASNVPKKVQIRDNDNMIDDSTIEHPKSDLGSRIGTFISEGDELENQRPKTTGSLLDRIGSIDKSKFKEKNLDKDDLFN